MRALTKSLEVMFRFLVPAVVALAILPASAGALQFEQPADSPYSIGTGGGALFAPNDMATGDLNGDGRADVVTANYSPNSYSVLLAGSSGALALQPGSPYSVSIPLNGVALTDVNDDGDLDMALTGTDNGGRLLIYEGYGDGTFSFLPSATVPAGTNGSSLTTGDLDGDGLDDLVTTDYVAGTVHTFRSVAGSYTPVPAGPFGVGQGPIAATTGDFNEDGFDDIATANYTSFFDNTFSVLIGNGLGGYALTPPTGLDGSYRPFDITSGRFDSTGHIGLAEANTPNGDVPVKLGNGDGTFFDAPGDYLEFPSHLGGTIASADLDGDSIDDLILPYSDATSGPENAAMIYLGRPDGQMVADPSSPVSLDETSPVRVNTDDFNGDGLTDFAVVGYNNAVAVMLNAAPSISVDPEEVDFGDMQVGGTTVTRSVTVSSDGNLPLTVSGATIEGADAADFSVTDDTCSGSPVPAGDTCQIQLAFDAGAIGARAAGLRIVSDGANDDSLLIPLEGNGEPNPGIAVDPSEASFTGIVVGTGPTAPIPFTVTSTGDTPLEISTVTLTGADADQFVIGPRNCSQTVLQPEAECVIDVSSNPTDLGANTANLTIGSNLDGPTEIPVTGLGLDDQGIELDPVEADFGSTTVGDGPGAPRTFEVRSTGTTQLEIGEVDVAGPDADQFELTADECTDQDLAPETTCEVEIVFEPTTTGEKTAELQVPSGATEGPTTADFAGNGLPPVIPVEPGVSIDPGQADFGRIIVDEGPSASRVFTVESTGTGPLDIGEAKITGDTDQFREISDGCSGRQLEPAATCRVEIAFAPTRTGQMNGRLEISSNAAGAAAGATITGTGDVRQNPCEPVSVRPVAGYSPAIKRRPQYLGVRARFTTEGKAMVRARATVKVRIRGKFKSFSTGRTTLRIGGGYRNYKVALPRALRRKAKHGDKAIFTITYSSRTMQSGCSYGPERSRRLNTRVIWIRTTR